LPLLCSVWVLKSILIFLISEDFSYAEELDELSESLNTAEICLLIAFVIVLPISLVFSAVVFIRCYRTKEIVLIAKEHTNTPTKIDPKTDSEEVEDSVRHPEHSTVDSAQQTPQKDAKTVPTSIPEPNQMEEIDLGSSRDQ
jgi:hypothetical protein